MGLRNAAGSIGPALPDGRGIGMSIAAARDDPPSGAGESERLQMHGLELWSRLADRRPLPILTDLDPGAHPLLSPFCVLLDITCPSADPAIAFLGESLAQECGVSQGEVERVSGLPDRSLLARVAEHYLATLDRPAPIGFEAECINQRGRAILYRGILLPFTRHHWSIDFVFGVISWKEAAEAATWQSTALDWDRGNAPGGKAGLEPVLAAHALANDPVRVPLA